MWHSLSDDARQAIEDLRRRHGDRLYDYLRTTLDPGEAELALAGTLMSACVHVKRVLDDEHLRAWLYGLARAHRASAASRSGLRPYLFANLESPLSEAMAGLSPAHREVLDLAVRHGLSHVEIALIFDAGAVQVEALVDEAREHLAAATSHDAGSLPDELPIVTAPDTLADSLAMAEPLGEEQALWRADGFPAQPTPLPDAPRTPGIRFPGMAKNPPFRAWEQAEEFWQRRPDESDPEARLSLRPLVPALRVFSLIVAVVTGVLLIGMAWSGLQPTRRAHTTPPTAQTITLIATVPPSEPAVEEPPGPAPTPAPTGRATAKPSRDQAGPGKPSGTPTATGRATSGVRIRRLPEPAAPSARVSPAGISLGQLRTGSFTLKISPGRGRVVSTSASDGIVVDGTRFTVAAPLSRPGCSPSNGAGTIMLTWRATNTGDGRTSAGATTTSGTVTIRVSWTVVADKGTWMPTGRYVNDGQGHWSNCPNG
ncbi:RNA polymerase sigma factor [Nonomuraea sp. CA-218870]|uniref:RNA polymerase sigma factor n=1 Tax=Nonomuraea sp. CA-218870 TaxID=3239998 RepID=UPI003D8A4962